ncbi:hypothetical protein J6590_069037 [Homalodisca vitripennis]|nr:hypothetical protein J6590_069037 [Homalodisca vitripennis]
MIVHRTWRFQQSPHHPPLAQVPAAVNPQHQHSGRLQHISYAEALRKYPVLDSGDKSGSAAAVQRRSGCFDVAQRRGSCWCHRGLRVHIADRLTRNRLF